MKRRNQKEISTPKTKVGKTNRQLGAYTQKAHRKPSEQLFANRRPLSYTNLNKKYENGNKIKKKKHKNSTPKHERNGTTTGVSPWNDQ